MPKVYPPELKKYMDKEVQGKSISIIVGSFSTSIFILTKFLITIQIVRLNGARYVKGFVRGFDPFMNLVLDEATDSSSNSLGMIVIRGNAIMAIEAIDRIFD